MATLMQRIDAYIDIKGPELLAEAKTEIERLRVDAERYRWLADNSDGEAQNDFIRWMDSNTVRRADVDMAIDAAMAWRG